MSLVVLSFFRDAAAGAALADLVAAQGGILGAAVCCSDNGGEPADDWTTCEPDRDSLLDRWVTAKGPFRPDPIVCMRMAALSRSAQLSGF